MWLYFKPYAKCDSINNNVAEIFNGFIMHARYMPIISMFKTMFKFITKRIIAKKKIMGIIFRPANRSSDFVKN